jgi:phosphate starvation-inducible PhoH-like protein
LELTVTLDDINQRVQLFGNAEAHLRTLRDTFEVNVTARDGRVQFSGTQLSVKRAALLLDMMQKHLRQKDHITKTDMQLLIRDAGSQRDRSDDHAIDVYVSNRAIAPRTQGQTEYVKAISSNDLIFCTGPAGSGKTYLAVAMAVSMLKRNEIRRIVLARPAVEAGEKLGFLPGDLFEKVNPYLRPLFDALGDMMNYDQIKRFMAEDIIEVIPLAFMRGQTLNDAIVILDEAQNTTMSQMLMFLTRLGHHSKMIVTGDDSQSDLANGRASGLADAKKRLSGIKNIHFIRLTKVDIVRHRLVQNIVKAYENPPLRNP